MRCFISSCEEPKRDNDRKHAPLDASPTFPARTSADSDDRPQRRRHRPSIACGVSSRRRRHDAPTTKTPDQRFDALQESFAVRIDAIQTDGRSTQRRDSLRAADLAISREMAVAVSALLFRLLCWRKKKQESREKRALTALFDGLLLHQFELAFCKAHTHINIYTSESRRCW